MKAKLLPFFVAITLILLVTAGYFGIRIIQKNTPSKELADINDWYHVEGDQVALIFNDQQQDTQGLYVDGQTYLPITWVNNNLNDRFYWDDTEKILVYALPDKIVYADSTTIGGSGHPLLWVTDDKVYLSMGMVLNYTNIRITAYDQGDVKRVLIDNNWNPERAASVKRAVSVRTDANIKSPILTVTAKDAEVKIVEETEKWVKVRTGDGHVGYVQSRYIAGTHDRVLENKFQAPVYKSTSLDEKICLVWHQVTTMDANAGLETLIKNTKGVNVVSPTWFALTDNDGNYSSLASKEYVDQAHSMGIQVWALIDNFSKNVQTEVLMASTTNRKKLIDSLMRDVERYGLDGINLDIESIKEKAGVHYVQFIRELSIPCRKNGIVLSVDNHVPAAYNSFYNRKEQGIVADYVIIMGYDEHTAGGDAGSVASIGFVEKGIIDTLKDVPKEKVLNAVPFYTRIWKEDSQGLSSSAMGIAKAQTWIKENQIELYWQEELGQYYGEAVDTGSRKFFWMEEDTSMGLKVDLINKYGLAGTACWKLGLEYPEIWDIISAD